nr:hypothetical protein [Tanacetum cinerariifolium]
MDSSHFSARSSVSYNSVSPDVVESFVLPGIVLNAFTEEIVAYEKESNKTHAVKKLNALCTPESFVTHSNFDTPNGIVCYIPKVSVDVLLVKRNVYDSVDDCVVAYMKHAAEAWFVVRRSCQKRMLNGDVKQKYLVCNRMGCPKGIHVDTLDLGNSDKQKRNSNLHITGCKVRAVFNLDTRTRKFVLNVFNTIHNHELEREECNKSSSPSNRKKHVSDFSFDYLVENVELTAIFRADEVSKYNYREFGYVVSFDATFKTNNIDNHRKCVMVAAGLLKNETKKSYIWLLKAFMKAFGKAPSIVVTDQDGAMRNAIEAEFGGSKHRLCMWHITQKLPDKKLNKIVWNMYIGLEEFEYGWGKLMEEFKLENHKTTSKSESENSFFSYFTNSGSTLMNFMNCFETAMEKQRHVQERMDHNTIDIVPKLKTLLKIEHHASNVYTRSEVCIIKKSPYVYEMPNNKKKKPQYVDKWNDKAEENDKVDLFFKIDGLYKVLWNVEMNANVEMISQQYILRRWTKNLIPAALRNKRNRYDEPRLGAFVEKLKSLKKEVEADCPNPPSKNKTNNLEQLVGVPKPPVVDVNNPTVGSTKGRKKLCIKGGKEKAIEKSLKGRNSCSLCGGTEHNKRTCPWRFEGQDEVVFQKEVVKRKFWFKKKCVKRKLFKKK